MAVEIEHLKAFFPKVGLSHSNAPAETKKKKRTPEEAARDFHIAINNISPELFREISHRFAAKFRESLKDLFDKMRFAKNGEILQLTAAEEQVIAHIEETDPDVRSIENLSEKFDDFHDMCGGTMQAQNSVDNDHLEMVSILAMFNGLHEKHNGTFLEVVQQIEDKELKIFIFGIFLTWVAHHGGEIRFEK